MFFFAIFVNYFVHNVPATVSYGRKELLDFRTAITHLGLDKDFFFNKQDAQDSLQTPSRADLPLFARGSDAGTKSRMSGQDPEKASGKAAITINATRQHATIGQ